MRIIAESRDLDAGLRRQFEHRHPGVTADFSPIKSDSDCLQAQLLSRTQVSMLLRFPSAEFPKLNHGLQANALLEADSLCIVAGLYAAT